VVIDSALLSETVYVRRRFIVREDYAMPCSAARCLLVSSDVERAELDGRGQMWELYGKI